MQFRVGQDIVTSCGKCKQRTTHVVFAMEGPRVKRVQCKICLSYHNYRPDPEEVEESPRSAGTLGVRRRSDGTLELLEEATPEAKKAARPAKAERLPKAERPPKAAPRPRVRKEPEPPDWSALWGQALQGKDPEVMINYRPDLGYEDGMLLNHNSFGVGVIIKVSPEKRMQVLFKDGYKTLVCNRI